MATYSNNTTIKIVSGNIGYTVGGGGASQSVSYTVPSGCYFACYGCVADGTSATINVNGYPINTGVGGSIQQFPNTFHIGPGSVIQFTNYTGYGSWPMILFGTLFQNTP